MKVIRKTLLFFAVLSLGILLRIWRLDKVPISLFGDEIDVGLHAFSILNTGKDYLGNSFPLIFHSFAEYRLPIQLYAASFFIKVFGLNEWGVRLPSVFFAILTIVSFYFLVKEMFEEKVAVIAVFFLTISPWHFIYSRQANDAGFLLPFIILGTLFFIKGTRRYTFLFLSVIFFSLSIYAYAISSVFTPIFVLTLLVIYRKRLFKYRFKRLALVAIVGLLILFPYISESIGGVTGKRFSDITTVSKNAIEDEVILNRKWTNTPVARLFYNKATVFGQKVLNNYAESLSISFLFFEGDPNLRHSVGEFGEFYHFDIVLILFGLITIVMNFKRSTSDLKRFYFLLFSWLLLAPLPSALTVGGGVHASRLILLLLPLILVSALGFDAFLKLRKSIRGKLVVVILIVFMFFDISKFFHRYFVIWPYESWRMWQSGFKETINYVKNHDTEYNRIYLNNTYEPMLPRFLFWYQYDMESFHKQFEGDEHIKNLTPGFNGFKLADKYYFGELKKPIEPLAKKGHLVVAAENVDVTSPDIFKDPNLNLLTVIYSPSDDPIFYLYTANDPNRL